MMFETIKEKLKNNSLFIDEDVMIINDDCLNVLKMLPDKGIDLLFTDPPYGINISRGKETLGGGGLAKPRIYGELEWDKQKLSEEYFKEMFRVSKEQAIFGANYYTDYTDYIKPTSSWVIWDKRCSNEIRNNFGDGELCYVSKKIPTRIYRFLWNGFMVEGRLERIHPTEKPIPVAKYILSLFNLEKESIVIDCFGGSGNILKASLEYGYKVIYVEKEEKYCLLFKDWVLEYKKQLKLF